eukprot:Polyplicarium_translucidae@DN2967_c0_g1_i2.p1
MTTASTRIDTAGRNTVGNGLQRCGGAFTWRPQNSEALSVVVQTAMVFKYPCSDPRFSIYMGRDKFENELMLQHGWPEDVWFHVSGVSSAHVYLRLPTGVSIDAIPQSVLNEVAQIVKNNSITGKKAQRLDVIYTPWENVKPLKEPGHVTFVDESLVRTMCDVVKDKDVANRLEKARTEPHMNLKVERRQRDKQVAAQKKQEEAALIQKEKADKLKQQEEDAMRSYEGLFRNREDDDTAPLGDGTLESCREIEHNFL